jgi:photosystem II stability/assembly factor-like uncharacterized protein
VPDTFCINSIFFSDKNTGYLAGAYDNGLTPYREILKTEDGGSSWNSIYSGGCETFKSIYFINRDTGYAVGIYECPDAAQTAAIWKTTDGGSTWVEEELKGSMGRPLNSVFFPDENTGYAVGYMGSILKTDDQTAGFSYDDPGTEQRLKIYPNPVSRTADIRYSISDIRYSNLSIFDAYGRLVETLVDGVQQPGEYTVSWNAENLPSGIYVFRLMAGDEVVSGKIIKR